MKKVPYAFIICGHDRQSIFSISSFFRHNTPVKLLCIPDIRRKRVRQSASDMTEGFVI